MITAMIKKKLIFCMLINLNQFNVLIALTPEQKLKELEAECVKELEKLIEKHGKAAFDKLSCQEKQEISVNFITNCCCKKKIVLMIMF